MDFVILSLSILCTIFYVVIMPFALKNKNIKVHDNQFQDFVNNDSGYAWSISSNRKKQYYHSLNKRLKINAKQRM